MLTLLLTTLLSLMELNCENLFDCRHDSLKEDYEFLPEGGKHWTRTRYWRKLNRTGQVIVAAGEWGGGWHLPDLVALCEVENDSVVYDLTRKSLLRKARYDYVVTSSPDVRGIDVALLYNPFSFAKISSRAIRVPPVGDMRPTRDILYVSGRIMSGDTLHVFVVHAPSRRGGERQTRPHRIQVMRQLGLAVDSLRLHSPHARIIVTGDFNEVTGGKSLSMLMEKGFEDISAGAEGDSGVKSTYRWHGVWQSLDHVFCSQNLSAQCRECRIFAPAFLLHPDERYGGVIPWRTYLGPRYQGGFSDHLPIIARFEF